MPSKPDKPSYLNFEKTAYAWKPDIDYRKNPEAYKVGKGEQGVLICEPYKSEIGQYWRFKTEAIAKISSEQIINMFKQYLNSNDFVGADMARKYLQMGFTRARRYANYKGGKKYDKDNDYQQLQRGTGEAEKAAAAQIFFDKWQQAEADAQYAQLKKEWKNERG
ncbi:DUF4385 domain-containing protein [Mucilaginibacter pallidiroseus]|uniref:DUF4385 domain-containing protein n=1 Tax=Mucilaginibacter pallidiroseus TaxID=2599295 RepID=A0A563UIL8_9SPHI|nr:DUF4385 domain-containing protein [Mucilaginibacter pallidiroseus]TWR31205.1 DUF4385 domain-containing protein [Mucilaginibacter pallidiroseus]